MKIKDYAVVKADTRGYIRYYDDEDRYHRLDGPAVISHNQDKFWYMCGKCHRLDGPSCIWANGETSWYINETWYMKSCHNRLVLFSVLESQRFDLNPAK
jgi:hypothetical protein